MSDQSKDIDESAVRAVRYRRALMLLLIVMLAFAVRSLTANFIRAHFNDPAWFQASSYSVFDRQAQAILDRREPVFFIADSTRTDRIVHPPLYPVWVALVYALTRDRSPAPVQRVQLILDSLAVLLIVGIGATAFGWHAGTTAGVVAAIFSPLVAAGATPSADAPTSWLVLGAVWLLLVSAKRQKILSSIGAGALLGVACWIRVNPVLLFVAWAAGLLFTVRSSWQRRLGLSATAALATLLVISPVVVRNLVVFYPEIAPTGLNVGLNLWEGIGETDRGLEFGAPVSDTEVIEQDRKEMGLPSDAPLELNYPDGIRRDHERGRKALAVIKSHPIWYAGTMVPRGLSHLKYAGDPAPHVGSVGFNVTSKKCLPPSKQNGPLAIAVNILGDTQSVVRYVALPLMLIGIAIALRRDWRTGALILATVSYYMATLAIGHSEIRYGLPMQALLCVFAGLGICYLSANAAGLWRRLRQSRRASLRF